MIEHLRILVVNARSSSLKLSLLFFSTDSPTRSAIRLAWFEPADEGPGSLVLAGPLPGVS
ncbi:MAG: hypothetical protein ABSG43_28430 [Solirubrobacteraceae bacterium]